VRYWRNIEGNWWEGKPGTLTNYYTVSRRRREGLEDSGSLGGRGARVLEELTDDEEDGHIVDHHNGQNDGDEGLEGETGVNGDDVGDIFDLDGVEARAERIEELATDEGKEAEGEGDRGRWHIG
jgi:hypothetical protein